MAFFDWKEEYSVNIEQIDSQHKILVDMINQIYIAMHERKSQEILESTLEGMISYAANHFLTEEHLMSKHGYPYLAGHKQEHDQFKEKINEYVSRVENGKRVLPLEIVLYLKEWLAKHILETDKNYMPFLSNKGVS